MSESFFCHFFFYVSSKSSILKISDGKKCFEIFVFMSNFEIVVWELKSSDHGSEELKYHLKKNRKRPCAHRPHTSRLVNIARWEQQSLPPSSTLGVKVVHLLQSAQLSDSIFFLNK